MDNYENYIEEKIKNTHEKGISDLGREGYAKRKIVRKTIETDEAIISYVVGGKGYEKLVLKHINKDRDIKCYDINTYLENGSQEHALGNDVNALKILREMLENIEEEGQKDFKCKNKINQHIIREDDENYKYGITRLYYFIGCVYEKLGDFGTAKDYFEVTMLLAPNKQLRDCYMRMISTKYEKMNIKIENEKKLIFNRK